jgi:hypothetical protein
VEGGQGVDDIGRKGEPKGDGPTVAAKLERVHHGADLGVPTSLQTAESKEAADDLPQILSSHLVPGFGANQAMHTAVYAAGGGKPADRGTLIGEVPR